MNNTASTLLLSALLAAPLASAFKLTGVAPRIFSPRAADAAANRVNFSFSNPDGAEVTIRIFDVGGALVRRNLDYDPGTGKMYWNGRNQGGSFVKGGVYIYQIETGAEVLTGTVVVAI